MWCYGQTASFEGRPFDFSAAIMRRCQDFRGLGAGEGIEQGSLDDPEEIPDDPPQDPTETKLSPQCRKGPLFPDS